MSIRGKQRDTSDIYHLHGKKRRGPSWDQYGEESAGSMDTGFRHSSRYHDFFDGYTEVRVAKPNGGYRIERYYTAPWMTPQLSQRERVELRLLYWCLYLGALLLYGWSMCQRVGSNTCPYVAAPGLVTVVPLLLLLFRLIAYTAGKEKLTKYDYKHLSKGVRWWSFLTGCGLTLTAITVLIYGFLHLDAPENLRNGLLLLCGAACALAISRLEQRVPYQEVENTTAVPEGGFEIR
ncbi:MAG: hypothetical protein LIO78_05450 [Clostridiales bacterium]|nr:hypothetical protein [Clostridiales bacterium]MCC8099495.1 hypothetical protein [Clostridiales bacterium]